MSPRTLFIAGLVTALLYGSFYLVAESPAEVLLFLWVNALAFLIFTLVYVRLRKPGTEEMLPVVISFGILFRLILLFHDPVGSDDIYRYAWDGKVAASGVNPFAYAPDDTALSHLRTADLPARVNFPEMRTIYPPLAQVLFAASHRMFGDSLAGLKFLLLIADVASIGLLVLLTSGFRNRVAAVFLYAWSPLPVMYFGLDGHIDALGIPFLLLSVYFLRRSKRVYAAAALGLSVLAKLYPLFAAPFLISGTREWKKTALPAIPCVMLLIGGLVYWEPTGGLIESFLEFNKTFEFNGSIFHVLFLFIGSNVKAHYASTILFVCWLAFVFILPREYEEKLFLGFLGFILVAPVVQPWYLTWLAALLAIRWSTGVFLLTGLSNLSNITVYQYRLTGVWQDYVPVLLLEYIPVFALLLWELMRGKFRADRHATAME